MFQFHCEVPNARDDRRRSVDEGVEVAERSPADWRTGLRAAAARRGAVRRWRFAFSPSRALDATPTCYNTQAHHAWAPLHSSRAVDGSMHHERHGPRRACSQAAGVRAVNRPRCAACRQPRSVCSQSAGLSCEQQGLLACYVWPRGPCAVARVRCGAWPRQAATLAA